MASEVEDRDLVRDLEHSSRAFVTITTQAIGELHTTVSQAGMRALLVLVDADGCTLSELARRVPLSQSATSRMVERLVKGGLVSREPSAEDRRQIRITMTPSGAALVRRMIDRRQAAIRDIIAAMDSADVSDLRRALQAFAEVTASRVAAPEDATRGALRPASSR